MIEMVDKEYIRKKHLIEGWSIRKISRNVGIARQTVRKALENSDIPQYNLTKLPPAKAGGLQHKCFATESRLPKD